MAGGQQRRMTSSQDDYGSKKQSTRYRSSTSSNNNINDSKSKISKSFKSKSGPSRSRKSPAVSGCYIYVLSALVVLTGFLLWAYFRQRPSPSSPPQPVPKSPTTPTTGSHLSVHYRGLVTKDVSYASILAEHSQYWSNVSHRHFQSSVLAYVTPWNGKGYDMAKIFRGKLTHVSPVWYQLKRSNDGVNLHGRHNVDVKWMNDVRHGGSPLIVPRVVLEGWPLDILVKEEEREKALLLLVDEIREMELDGIVLEAWSLWRGQRILDDPKLRRKALEFVKVLGLELHTRKGSHLHSKGSLQLIFVISPPGKSNDPTTFTTSDMIYLSDAVDAFSLMTYDYSSPYSPGPNAPLGWIRQCLRLLLPGDPNDVNAKSNSNTKPKTFKSSSRDFDDPGKVLMGLNFYGNDYSLPQGGGAIVGHEYISLLSKHRPQIMWDDATQEHYFHYKKEKSKGNRNRVYYPSLKSLSARLKEAEAWGVGISIWEIGQGLDYFFDLL